MRCKRFNCRVKGAGDLCARCAYETDWLETRDYFCSSPGCQKHMTAPTPSTLCPDCERDIKPWQVAKLAKTAEQEAGARCVPVRGEAVETRVLLCLQKMDRNTPVLIYGCRSC